MPLAQRAIRGYNAASARTGWRGWSCSMLDAAKIGLMVYGLILIAGGAMGWEALCRWSQGLSSDWQPYQREQRHSETRRQAW